MDDQPQKERRRPGRPKKAGPARVPIHLEVPGALVEMLRADAAEQRVSQGDRLAEILAAHYSQSHQQEAMQQAS